MTNELNILFPLSEKWNNQASFNFCQYFANKFNSSIVYFDAFLLNIDDDITQTKYQLKLAERKSHYKKKINNFKSLNKLCDNCEEYKIASKHGVFEDEILNTLESEKINLIVSCNSNLKTVTKIIGKKNIIQIIVPDNFEMSTIRDINVIADFNKIKKFNALKFLSAKLKNKEMQINLVHIPIDSGNKEISAIDIIKDQTNNYDNINENIIYYNNLESYLNENNNTEEIRVIIKRETGILSGLLHKSLTDYATVYNKIVVIIPEMLSED